MALDSSYRFLLLSSLLWSALFDYQIQFTHALAFSPLMDRREWIQATTTTTAATLATTTASNTLFVPFLQPDDSILHYPGKAVTPPLDIPRIGYSLYKTNVTQAALGVQLALQAGVRHFDVATLYSNNEQVASVLRPYIQSGLEGVPNQPWTPRQRRRQLFVTLKVPPASSQSIVQQTVKTELDTLGLDHIDLVMIHSPLADSNSRLLSYEALLDLQRDGLAKGVGVCHYGLGPLNELVSAGLPPPAVIQLVLSPFNQHKDIAAWAQEHGSVLSCNAWSMLSSVNGPQEGWDKLAKIAKAKGVTKAQVLVRWALQRGYLCVPRSGTKSKMERLNIAENSYQGVKAFYLDSSEMDVLNGLDEQLPAGRLGIVDGWDASAIVSPTWDPTQVA